MQTNRGILSRHRSVLSLMPGRTQLLVRWTEKLCWSWSCASSPAVVGSGKPWHRVQICRGILMVDTLDHRLAHLAGSGDPKSERYHRPGSGLERRCGHQESDHG